MYEVVNTPRSRVAAVDFPERLATLRRARGLTQNSVAERAGVHVTQFQRYEAGTSEPTLGVLRRLAIALSVSSDSLVFGDDSRLPDDETLRLAFESTVHLDAEERRAVQIMLEGFLARHEVRRGEEGPRGPKTSKR